MQFKGEQFVLGKNLGNLRGTVTYAAQRGGPFQIDNQRQLNALVTRALDNVEPTLNPQEKNSVAESLKSFVRNSFNELKISPDLKIDSDLPIPKDLSQRWATASAKGLEFIAFDPLHQTTIIKLSNRYGEKIYFALGSRGEVLEVGVPTNNKESEGAFEEGYKRLAITSRKADELLKEVRKAINRFGDENKLSSPEVSEYLEAATKGVFEYVQAVHEEGGSLSELSMEGVDIRHEFVGIVYLDRGRKLVTAYPTQVGIKMEPNAPEPEAPRDVACNFSPEPHSRFFKDYLTYSGRPSDPYSESQYQEHKKIFHSDPRDFVSSNKTVKVEVFPRSILPDKAKIVISVFLPERDRVKEEKANIFVEKDSLSELLASYKEKKPDEMLTIVKQNKGGFNDEKISETLEISTNAYLKKALELGLIEPSKVDELGALSTLEKVNEVINSGLARYVREGDLKEQESEVFNRIKNAEDPNRQALVEISKLVESAADAGFIDTCESSRLIKQAREELSLTNWERQLKAYQEKFSRRLYEFQIFSFKGGEPSQILGGPNVPNDLNRSKLAEIIQFEQLQSTRRTGFPRFGITP